jgi:hypothetical protein
MTTRERPIYLCSRRSAGASTSISVGAAQLQQLGADGEPCGSTRRVVTLRVMRPSAMSTSPAVATLTRRALADLLLDLAAASDAAWGADGEPPPPVPRAPRPPRPTPGAEDAPPPKARTAPYARPPEHRYEPGRPELRGKRATP